VRLDRATAILRCAAHFLAMLAAATGYWMIAVRKSMQK
jgi:hypothetical protein